MEYDREYFESGTKSGYTGYGNDPRFAELAEQIISKYPNAKTIVDFGCAKGFLVKALREKGKQAFGIDISEYAIGAAPDDVKPYLRRGNILEMKLRPTGLEAADLVVSVDTLEHFSESEIPALVEALKYAGKEQLHYVTYKEVNPGSDPSHKTLKPASWWKEQFPDAEIIES